jgi:hypothetical protein
VEVYAYRDFPGLCYECRTIFATWEHPEESFTGYYARKSAHHSFEDIEQCRCPLCKMLLSMLVRYSERLLQRLRLRENHVKRSDVNVYQHKRSVACYFVELIFTTEDRQLNTNFMMFPDYVLSSEPADVGSADAAKGQSLRLL